MAEIFEKAGYEIIRKDPDPEERAEEQRALREFLERYEKALQEE
jgi:hypothetical protein